MAQTEPTTASPATASPTPLRIAVLTVGTRGDVQPFVALGHHMQRRGHTVMICTSSDFKPFVEKHGVQFAECGLETVVQPPEWFTCTSAMQMVKATSNHLKLMFDAIATPLWIACRDFKPDVLLVMPLTVGFGKNIADKLAIPCWVTNFSQATISGYYGPTYEPTANVLRRGWNKTKKVVESLGFVWANRNGIIQQFAKWRKSVLELPDNPVGKELASYRLPSLCAISPTLFPPAPDFPPEVFVTGFWFLDACTDDVGTSVSGVGSTFAGIATPSSPSPGQATGQQVRQQRSGLRSATRQQALAGTPPATTLSPLLPPHLSEFLHRIAPRKPVCVNFGSMVRQSEFVANLVRVVVQELRQPCVLVAGWNSFSTHRPMLEALGPQLCVVKAVPHEELFPRCSVVVYHGGSGTVARVMQAAIPSVVVPILKWSDQPLFGKQLQQQGLGEVVTNEALIPSSIQRVLDSAAVQRCAQAAGHSLANEHGLVVTASALESCLCQRVKPSTTADVEFCQRHCVKCNTRLRRASTGAARLALGWDVYYQPKPRTWTNVVVHAVMWLLFAWCLWQLVVLFRR